MGICSEVIAANAHCEQDSLQRVEEISGFYDAIDRAN
jgi:hypothetical protein